MSTNWLAEQISSVLGMSTEDIKEQIIPYVDSMTTRMQAERHLQELCGSAPFIATYLDRRFPLRMPPPAQPKAPAAGASTRSAGPTPSQAFPATIKPNAKKAASKPTEKVLPASSMHNGSSVPKPEDLAFAFGGAPGQVYIKNREDDLGWGGSGKKKGSRAGTEANTPVINIDSEDGGSMDRSRSFAGTSRGISPSIPHSATGSRHHSPERKPKKLEATEPERPKTREMKKIERIIEGVKKLNSGQAQEASKMDGQEGCFCMARTHSLSTYTPACAQCGLILCSLHLPYHPCPHCKSVLLGPSGIMRVIAKLNDELGVVLRREDEAKRRALEDERLAYLAATGGGAFPTLNMSAGGVPVKDAPKPEVGRKVMTIGGGSTAPATIAQKLKGGRSAGRGKAAKATVVMTRTASPRSGPISSQKLENNGVQEDGDDGPGRGKGQVHRTHRPVENDTEAGERRYKDLQDRKRFNEMWREQESRRFGDRVAVLQGWDAQYEPITQEEKDEEAERLAIAAGKGKDQFSLEKQLVPGAEIKSKSKGKNRSKGKGKENDIV